MAKRERNKPQRRRRSRVESTVQMDGEYVEATTEAAAKMSKSKSTPQSTAKKPEMPDRVEKIEPEEGSKTFGPNDAGWVVVEIGEDNQQAAVTALHFGEKKVRAQLFVDALRDSSSWSMVWKSRHSRS